jgi:hypothetical protein
MSDRHDVRAALGIFSRTEHWDTVDYAGLQKQLRGE